MIGQSMRVFFTNLGCKLNQAEVEALARRFEDAGHQIVGSLDQADVHVVNSCTVTHLAARDSRKAARRAQRLSPHVKTVLTGCHVDAEPGEAIAIEGVDLVVPNARKHLLLSEIEERLSPGPKDEMKAQRPLEVPYVPIDFGNTRALVKVEDGCNMRCSFCVIPATRGRQRSRPLDEVVTEVRSLVASGAKEVVITGVQISSYRWRTSRLFDLVGELLDRTTVPRIRLTSIAPWQFDTRLLELLSSGRVCRHFHLSLQSGCDETLAHMRRPYSTEQFARLVDGIRAHDRATAITTDVIVGFPGESESSFERTLSFTESMSFARLHAFPYSSRPRTEAAGLDDHVRPEVKRERMTRLLDVARRSERRFQEACMGETAEALWEGKNRELWVGTTDNYIRVTSRREQPVNEICAVRLERIGDRGVEVEHRLESRKITRGPRPQPMQPGLHQTETLYRAEENRETRETAAR
jgi:threonylcarbamoyladenosine tRNA methylthiotransferase MtaB